MNFLRACPSILINFHAYPKVVIHKFFYDASDKTITAF